MKLLPGKLRLSNLFLRNDDSVMLAEIFLVNAVVAIVAIRSFLTFTGFPTLGGDQLHIAHMLWGGLLMLSALVLAFSYLGHTPKYIAAIIGGLGFGAFIDELGKFITTDNDYFFKPTFALIYVIFIGLFFLFRWIAYHQPMTQREYLGNALSLLQDAVSNNFDRVKKNRVLSYIKRAELKNSELELFTAWVESIKTEQDLGDDPFTRGKDWLLKQYYSIANHGWFSTVIALIFVFQGLGAIVGVGLLMSLVSVIGSGMGGADLITEYQQLISHMNFFDWGLIISTGAANLNIIIGLIVLPKSRLNAFRWFRNSLYVSIFLVQFFSFYHDQLTAIFGLIIDIILLYSLNFIIYQEENS